MSVLLGAFMVYSQVTAESICEPRGSVYMTFLLLVPVLVLAFAYI